MKKSSGISRRIERFASTVISMAGSNLALVSCFALVILWGVSGFAFHWSVRWEAVIQTVSSVVTILMVFLIQKAQNKDSLAIQLKLNELVASNSGASNRLVNVEGMTEEELKIIQKYYNKLGEFAKNKDNLIESHSIDEHHEEHAIREELEKELEAVSKPNPPSQA
jgi:low affinity Fe/Cu permease